VPGHTALVRNGATFVPTRRTPVVPTSLRAPKPSLSAAVAKFTADVAPRLAPVRRTPLIEVPPMTLDGGRPGDRRGFIHKKILGGIATIAGAASAVGIPGAGTVSRIAGRLGGSVDQKKRATQMKFPGSELGFGPVTCEFPMFINAAGECVSQRGVEQPVGQAVMGQYGAGLVPGSMAVSRAVCLRGMQLGNDGVCYNKSQISNKQRMWPAGRKPLLTGGDMRAIGIASRAGRRLEGATKRLQKMGMMKKPASRARGPTQHQRLLEAHVTK